MQTEGGYAKTPLIFFNSFAIRNIKHSMTMSSSCNNLLSNVLLLSFCAILFSTSLRGEIQDRKQINKPQSPPTEDSANVAKPSKQKVSLPTLAPGEPDFHQNFWKTTLEAGYAVALNSSSESNTLRFNVIQSLHFNQEVALGLGAGYREFGYPLFANLRLVGQLQKVSFVLEGSAGYTFEIGNNRGVAPEGFYINPRTGISFPMQGNKSWQLMVGYSLQKNAVVKKQPTSPARPFSPRLTSIEALQLLNFSVAFNL